MVDSRVRRHRRRHARAAPRRWRIILATLAAIGLILGLGYLFRTRDSRATITSRTDVPAAHAVQISLSGAAPHPTYNYSVIPGGAWDQRELARAIDLDPVVADHYRDVDPATMRPQIVASDRLAYVSYRLDDRVYWTKHKVRIRGGETILTNGQTEIRARCGNCISMAPLLPTSEEQPEESRFDALNGDVAPLLVSWNLNPFGAPRAVEDSPVGAPLPLNPVFPFLGGFAVPGGTTTDSPNGGLPGGSLPGGGTDLPPGGGTTPPRGGTLPPGGVNPPLVGGGGGGGFVVGDSALGPLVLDALLDDSTPPALQPTVPSDTSQVPEPATLLLLGSGIAGLFARHWRAKKI